MKFALVGLDTRTAEIAQAVAAAGDHRLACVYLDAGAGDLDRRAVEPLGAPVICGSPNADGFARLWETRPDVIVLAARQDAAALIHDVRQLAQLDLPIVVSHPVNHSAMVYYELEMLVQNSKSILLPYLPLRWHPAVQQLSEQVAGAAVGGDGQRLGRLEQITLDRTIRQSTRSELLDLFAADVDLVRTLAGDITDVAAMHSAADDQLPLPLNVQMTAQHAVLVRWSLTAVDQSPGGQLTLAGSRGSLRLRMADAQDWQWVSLDPEGEGDVLQTWPSPGPGQQNLERLVQRLEAVAHDPHASQPAWQNASRGVEVLEALEKSLRKRRLVHLSYEGRGEEEAFKGTMASLGCGLLLALMLLTVVAGIGLKLAKEQGLDRLAALLAKIPHVALGLMIVFLLMQLLRVVIPDKKK